MIARLLSVLLLLSPACLHAEVLTINTAHFPPRSTSDARGFEDLIVKEAFKRIGYDIKIMHLPSERCLVNVNNGVDDGNFARVAGLEALYTNLVRVPESIDTFEFAVFSKRKDIKVDGWNSLMPYKTGIVTGWKILEKNLGHLPMLTRATDQESLFSMLADDRLDVAVFDLIEGKEIIKRYKSRVYSIEPLLDQKEMFIYLNKKHTSLASQVAKSLKNMKSDGTYHKIKVKFNR